MGINSFNFKTCNLPGLVFKIFYDNPCGWVLPRLGQCETAVWTEEGLGGITHIPVLGQALILKLLELGQLQRPTGEGSIEGIE